MADNFTTNAGTGGAIFASDDLGGIQLPRVKVTWGVDGAGVDASATNPFPVTNMQESSSMTVGATPVTPKFAVVTASSIGATAVVAAVTSKKIRVLSYVLVASGDNLVKFQSGATDVTGSMPFTTNSGASAGFSPVGHFETAVTTALNINLTAALGVSGHLTYIEV